MGSLSSEASFSIIVQYIRSFCPGDESSWLKGLSPFLYPRDVEVLESLAKGDTGPCKYWFSSIVTNDGYRLADDHIEAFIQTHGREMVTELRENLGRKREKVPIRTLIRHWGSVPFDRGLPPVDVDDYLEIESISYLELNYIYVSKSGKDWKIEALKDRPLPEAGLVLFED